MNVTHKENTMKHVCQNQINIGDKAHNAIDWNAVESKAQRMSMSELHYALVDIQKTLPFADDLDRQDGGGRGGYYRDEASIYRSEMRRRKLTFKNAQEAR